MCYNIIVLCIHTCSNDCILFPVSVACFYRNTIVDTCDNTKNSK